MYRKLAFRKVVFTVIKNHYITKKVGDNMEK